MLLMICVSKTCAIFIIVDYFYHTLQGCNTAKDKLSMCGWGGYFGFWKMRFMYPNKINSNFHNYHKS